MTHQSTRYGAQKLIRNAEQLCKQGSNCSRESIIYKTKHMHSPVFLQNSSLDYNIVNSIIYISRAIFYITIVNINVYICVLSKCIHIYFPFCFDPY